MRSFIAISLPGELKHRLGLIQNRLKSDPKIRAGFPRAHGLHITIQFLGDLSPTQLEGVKKAMDLSVGHPGFYLVPCGLGVFPKNKAAARVLWAGLGGETARLKQTYTDLHRALASENIKFPGESFSPHITLARFKRSPSPGIIDRILKENTSRIGDNHFQIGAIHLYKSELAPSGARHTRLHTSRFRG